jgi:uncharacterized RDD family membrane protein YckC
LKCPKCGYLGFEEVERCRNCGHDFTVAGTTALPELSLRADKTLGAEPLDLELTTSSDQPAPAPKGVDLPLFGAADAAADPLPMLSRPAPPRPPLAVRRATPEVPRVRTEIPRTEPPRIESVRTESSRAPMLDLTPPEPPRGVESPVAEVRGLVSTPPVRADSDEAAADTAGLGRRAIAAAIDLGLLSVIDAIVIYFTLKICGLTIADLQLLPKTPLIAFLALQNAAYLAAFTAGGQTLGKMATGIRVIPVDSDNLDLGRSLKRTFLWGLLAAPAGLGFATAVFNQEHRGLHDRLAGTRVVRAGTA